MKIRPASALLVALLAAGAGMRLWQAHAVKDFYPGQEEGYYEQGVSWLSRGVLSLGPTDARPRSWRGPVYPAFSALVEVPFSRAHPAHLRYAVAFLSVTGVCAAYLLAVQLAGPLAGLLAAGLFSLDAGQALSASSLNVHAFYGLALLMLACVAARWAQTPSPRRGLMFGAALGLTLLTRSTHLFAAPFLFLIGAWRGDGARAAARRAAWPAAAFILVMLPWTTRNAVRFGSFQPLDANSGAVNLYTAASGDDITAHIEDAMRRADIERPGVYENFVRDAASPYPVLLSLAKAKIFAAPGAYARGILRRAWALYSPWWPVFPPLLLLLWQKRTRAVWAAAVTLLSLGAYPLVAVQSAYAEAAHPLSAALAGAGLASEWSRRRPRAHKEWESSPEVARGVRFGADAFFAVFALTLILYAALTLWEFRVLAERGVPKLRDQRASALVYLAARAAPRHQGDPALRLLLANEGSRALSEPPAAKPAEEVLTRALRLRDRGQLRSAIEVVSAALSSDPGNPSLLIARAGLRWDAVDAAAAIALDAEVACLNTPALAEPGRMPSSYFDACLSRFPGHVSLLGDRGVALWREGRREDAKASFRAALSKDPGNLPAAVSLASVTQSGGEGMRALRLALTLSHEPADSRLRRRAEIMIKQGGR